MCPSIWLDLWTIRVITTVRGNCHKTLSGQRKKKATAYVNLLEIFKSRDLTWLCLFLHFTEMQRDPPRRLQFCPISSRIWAKPQPLMPCSPARGASTLLGAGTGLGIPGKPPAAPRAGSQPACSTQPPPECHTGTDRELPQVKDGTEWKANTPTQTSQ